MDKSDPLSAEEDNDDQEFQGKSEHSVSDGSSPEEPKATELEQWGEERVKLLGKLARAQADLTNIKRRTEQELGEVRSFANQIFAAELLRVIDSMDRALDSIPDSLTGFAWIDGLLITRAQVDALLKSQGIEPINTHGEKFDPRYHEAVSSGDVSGPAETVEVLEEYQRGYMMHDRVLRPSLVRAGTSDAAAKDSDVHGDDQVSVDVDADTDTEVSVQSD